MLVQHEGQGLEVEPLVLVLEEQLALLPLVLVLEEPLVLLLARSVAGPLVAWASCNPARGPGDLWRRGHPGP